MTLLNIKTLFLLMAKVGHFLFKNKRFVPTHDHAVFQGTLIIILQSMSRVLVLPTHIRAAVG